MSIFDEIKQEMHDAIDKAWAALSGTDDLDAARAVAQATTEALHAQALKLEAHLVAQVADNAAAKSETNTGTTVAVGQTATVSNEHLPTNETPAQVTEAAPAETAPPLEPAQSAPEGSEQVNPTGMAANVPTDATAPASDTAAQ